MPKGAYRLPPQPPTDPIERAIYLKLASQRTKAAQARIAEETGGWSPLGKAIQREIQLWRAIYTVIGNFKLAKQLAQELVIWPQEVFTPDKYLRNWSIEIDEGRITADPALVKIVREKFDAYKAIRHWQFIEAHITAAKVITDQIVETGEAKQAVTLSYLGNNVNYGMDKGEHATKQASQQINMGNVRIISAHASPQLSNRAIAKAKKLAQSPKMIEGEVRVLE